MILLAIRHCGKPGEQLRPDSNDENRDELQDNKRYHSSVNMGQFNLGRCDALQIKEREADWRREKRCLQHRRIEAL